MAIRLIDDPRLEEAKVLDEGFTAMVTGPTGSGKTLALRSLVEKLGPDSGIVIATDPRLLPLEDTGVRVLKCWMQPGMQGADLKTAAIAAWGKYEAFVRDLALAAHSPDVEVPKWIALDSITSLGDIKAAAIAPANGQLSQPLWGELGRGLLHQIGYLRGLQVRGLIRIINCTSGWEKDEMGRRTQELFMGIGGKIAPKHATRYIDLMFHVEATYAPNDPQAGPDGMKRIFHTCEHDGIVAKGHPKIPTPFCKADWGYVHGLIFPGAEAL